MPQVARASMKGALRQLKQLGFAPATIIDVGVATQTVGLYEEFPNVSLLLIEPVAEYESFLKRIASEHNAQYVLAAAGEKNGTAILNIHDQKFGSSLLREVEGESVDGMPREVPMLTIDGLCAERGLRGPYLLKADVQGAEIRVLSGAKHTLEQAEVVILETAVLGTMLDGPEAWDVIDWMKAAGFAIYDLYELQYRPLDGALCQIDVVFVKDKGKFRERHEWATAEQREAMRITSGEF
jgi:FkbM family methyltransferase